MNVSAPPIRWAPPAPRGLPVVGSLPQMWRDPLRFFQRAAEEHGGIVRMRHGRAHFYLVTSPSAIERIFVGNSRNYWKGRGMEVTESVLGKGLATSEGSAWRRQRRGLQPAFASGRMGELVAPMEALIEARLDRWANAPTTDCFALTEAFDALTRDLIFTTLFDTDLGEDGPKLTRAFVTAQEYIVYRAWSPIALPERYPTLRNLRFRRAARELDRIVGRVTEEYHRGSSSGGLLDCLMSGDPREVRDQLVTLFFAGYETTASALTWIWYELGRRPELADELAEEAQSAENASALLSRPLVRAVVDEALRLYPPGWILVRTSYEADELDGLSIPAEATLLLSPYVTHRCADFWDRPEEFRPSRFIDAVAGDRPRFAYLPFGGGPRVCIGKQYALSLLRLVVGSVARRFRVVLRDRRPLRPRPLTTLQPRRPLEVVLRARSGGSRR